MTKKLIFNLTLVNGATEPVDYYPIVFKYASNSWQLALHREFGKGQWIVSDPVSGCRVTRVTASHKGCPVSSRHLTTAQARAAAITAIGLTIDRIGLDRFSAVLGAAQNPKKER